MLHEPVKRHPRAVLAPHVGDEAVVQFFQHDSRNFFVEVVSPFPPGNRIESFGLQYSNSLTLVGRHLTEFFGLAKSLQDSGHEFRAVRTPILTVEARGQLANEFFEDWMTSLEPHNSGG